MQTYKFSARRKTTSVESISSLVRQRSSYSERSTKQWRAFSLLLENGHVPCLKMRIEIITEINVQRRSDMSRSLSGRLKTSLKSTLRQQLRHSSASSHLKILIYAVKTSLHIVLGAYQFFEHFLVASILEHLVDETHFQMKCGFKKRKQSKKFLLLRRHWCFLNITRQGLTYTC